MLEPSLIQAVLGTMEAEEWTSRVFATLADEKQPQVLQAAELASRKAGLQAREEKATAALVANLKSKLAKVDVSTLPAFKVLKLPKKDETKELEFITTVVRFLLR